MQRLARDQHDRQRDRRFHRWRAQCQPAERGAREREAVRGGERSDRPHQLAAEADQK
ncbi:conserved hypothetical protein [Ricinus communis]|uniref:Uncharacterized protein n=1 Tax=Ricinus communis TaxID=3988 RepID=B9TFW8_RICCO|nr:conserved hypothetical protein [Ricinus communis]